MKRIITLLLGSCLLLFAASTCFAQMYTITDLGTLSPGAINNLGQIAAVNLNKHAITWTLGRVRDLGVLPGGTYSVPAALNDVGAVVGTADGFVEVPWASIGPPIGPPFTGYLPVVFVWTPSQGMKTIGYIDTPIKGEYPPGTVNWATGINLFGQVTANSGCCSYLNGYVWTQAGGLNGIGPYTYNDEALGINNRGQIVGWNGVSPQGQDYSSRASLWDNGVLTELGSLLAPSDPLITSCEWFTPSNGCGSVAYDINDVTQVVGWSAYNLYNSGTFSYSDYVEHAFLWTQKNGMEDLGTLPGDLSSVAKKINFVGQVIGSSYAGHYLPHGPDNGRPFVWSRQQGMRELNTLIAANSGWVLQSVADINIWGQIVGQGTRNGQPHGFLLTPRTLFSF